jgi:hypothetical protein
MKKAIKHLEHNKVFRQDGIPAELLKIGSEVMEDLLHKLIVRESCLAKEAGLEVNEGKTDYLHNSHLIKTNNPQNLLDKFKPLFHII